MLKINAIKFEVNTSSGLFGAEYHFTIGLNIVRGDNTSGKSSFFQAILYCLGLEELIGGRNEKTMQSVLKDVVEFPKDNFHDVLQSFVLLEIENQQGQIITLRRSIASTNRDSKLIDVFEEAVLSQNINETEPRPMFVHDKGGASDEYYGFHLFLEDFLGWELPHVLNKLGESRKLYLQQVASAFIIEQKSGWSDFFATMPYYSLTNKEARVVEFLLDLDVYENQRKRQKLNSDRRIIDDRWESLYRQFYRLAEKGGGKLIGLEHKPSIINDSSAIKILLTHNESDITVSNYLEVMENELEEIESKHIPSVSTNLNENELRLEALNNAVNRLSLNYEMLSTELSFDKDKLGRYSTQLQSLTEDLRKNKGALKMKKLGAEVKLKSANDNCPTCNQPVKDSLLPADIEQNPMNLEENISFIEAQMKMVDVYVDGVKHKIEEKEKNQTIIRNKISEHRHDIRQIKKELVADDRLPSELEIERKLNIKKRIEFFTKYQDEFADMLNEIVSLSQEYESMLKQMKNLPKEYFSSKDREKLSGLTNQFRRILNKVNYTSKPTQLLDISQENYLPIANEKLENGEIKSYNIRFDSSASDFVRCIWAYTCSLYKVSKEHSGNHPGLLMFDEPKQQDIALENFHEFLSELSTYNDAQVLVFASFENSDESFRAATEGLDFNLNLIEGKLIKPL